jgi:hypothetical protein
MEARRIVGRTGVLEDGEPRHRFPPEVAWGQTIW